MRVARPRLDMNTLLRPLDQKATRHGNEYPQVMSLSAHAIVVAILSVALHATGTVEAVTSVGHHPPAHLPPTTYYLPPTVNGADAVPWFGTWRLEAPKTAPRWFETPPYKKVTITIEPSAEAPGEALRHAPGATLREGLRVVYDMVRTRGGITHMEWVGRFDARDYPVQGAAAFMTNAYRQIDERSYEIVIKVDGATAATATAVVASDGATMTVTTVETAGGKSTAVYRRQ